MRYWDSSAIVPLLVEQGPSRAVRAAYDADPAVVTWWGSPIECMSALARLEREGWLSPSAMRIAAERLDGLEQSWTEVAPTDAVRAMAARLVRDDRLAVAAEREGLNVVAPAD